ncbi:hypothetical protein [Phytoactinopolyspora halotolerans]|uniref:Uncharacterized protein n=1 Tax=Phytoactinopolyspora halotolerans TaxID=1981512 RepID=A0A6L9S351_9ACTN|nr:hypothetical protein [Phytoactinopolyspora halotolerans]NED99486.1 hypothetical protein [Phytoactinopolyspora halotolerans]
MTPPIRRAALTSSVLLALPLVACGDDSDSADGGDYCGLIEDAQEEYEDASAESAADPDVLQDLADRYREIGDAAPSEVQDQWTNVADAMEQYAEIDWSDPETLQELEGDGEFAELMETSESAFNEISTNVQDECGIDFSGGTESGDDVAPEDDTQTPPTDN